MNNIDDVARCAGVSRSTVSRVIRDSENVSEKTKNRVLEAITQLNYVPNTAARALAGQKNNVIGVVCGYTLDDPFFALFVGEICKSCYERGYATFISAEVNEYGGAQKQIKLMRGKVDAYIFIGKVCIEQGDVERLLYNEVPVVLFKAGLKVDGAINVDIDNVESARKAINYLVDCGHRRIAYLRGNIENYESALRTKGVVTALKERKIEVDEKLFFEGKFRYKNAYVLTDEILKESPTAVFCESDIMAHGFMRRCKTLGVRVPEDVSVIGFDGIDFRNFEPFIKFTTIKQPVIEMARACLEQLMDGDGGGCDITFPTTMIENDTIRKI